ncbi:hemerythrin domain-containing protein [Streptosporangiaceae bacterium NEAU-GS5]|nr:hemerythrin domain-containing protein [Streptosporangiaceae bacterium NEAU-GS5]
MSITTYERPDTHDMVVVHRVFRRESRLLGELVTAVRPGDTARAEILAAHYRDYATALHHHHTAEDELVWPKLLARVDLEADLVLRMEAQHERISATMDQIEPLLPEWERSADPGVRDRIAAALADHHAALVEHLGEEEAHILALIEEHLTKPEWDAVGESASKDTPKDKLLLMLGAILEEATSEEAAHFLGRVPLPGRLAWRLIGRRQYAKWAALIRTP